LNNDINNLIIDQRAYFHKEKKIINEKIDIPIKEKDLQKIDKIILEHNRSRIENDMAKDNSVITKKNANETNLSLNKSEMAKKIIDKDTDNLDEGSFKDGLILIKNYQSSCEKMMKD
jgi:hypothetical protein